MREWEVVGHEEMRELGAEIAARLAAGDVVLLHGDLGAGKTTMAQGIAGALGVAGPVTSPTFTLVADYAVQPPVRGIARIHHLDLYRLTDPADLVSIGFDDYLTPRDAVSLIEWPERAGDWLPERALILEIEVTGPDRRRVRQRQWIA